MTGTAHCLLISSSSSGRGGGERYLGYLAHGLVSLGHTVTLLMSDASMMDPVEVEARALGAAVVRRPLRSLSQRRLRFAAAMVDKRQMAEVAAVCRSEGPDLIVVSQQYDEDGLDYVGGALQADVAQVAGIMHLPVTPYSDRRPASRLRRALLNSWYRRHPYTLVVVTQEGREEFCHRYSAPRPVHVIPHGVPFPRSPGRRHDTGRWGNIPVVGFVGQLVEQKEVFRLVRAWDEARRRGISARLLIVGDGPLRPHLDAYLRSAAPQDEWRITGWVQDPCDLYDEIDVFALASRFEAMSLSLVEAAGRGIPCVVAPFEGAHYVAGRAPWVRVAEAHSDRAYTDTLCQVLSRHRELRAEGRTGGAAFREHFSTTRLASDYLRLFSL